MHKIIEMCDVSIHHPDTSSERPALLESIHLSIASNSWTLLHGPSGSGKTTLLNMLAGKGETVIQSGHVRLHYDTNTVAYMPQQSCLLEGVSIRDNINMLYMLRYQRTPKHTEHLAEIMNFTLPLDQSIAHLSGGERMKIALLRALILKPKLLFLDEPSCHWDSQSTHEIMGSLKSLQQSEDLTIIMVSHDMELIQYSDSNIDIRMYQCR